MRKGGPSCRIAQAGDLRSTTKPSSGSRSDSFRSDKFRGDLAMTLFHQMQDLSIGRHRGRFIYNPVCSACAAGVPHRRHRKVAAPETGEGAGAASTAKSAVRGASPADVLARKIIDVHHHLMPPRYY